MHSSLRAIGGLLAAYGTYAAMGITVSHFHTAQACPTILDVPACAIVLLGYAVMLISMIKPHRWMFFAGWVPVFLLALSGVAGEFLSDTPVCPQTASGIPKCYFSFGLSVILGLIGFFITQPKALQEKLPN